jgi:hypothetical protein
VDNTEAPVSWITGATLAGNVCSFKINTSTVKASSIVYLKVFTSTTAISSVESRPISIQIKDTTPPPQPVPNP